MSTDTPTAKAQQFNKIFNQSKSTSGSKARTPEDIEEALKKLRRLILVNGIPSDEVSRYFFQTSR